jgi:hypothetical protein
VVGVEEDMADGAGMEVAVDGEEEEVDTMEDGGEEHMVILIIIILITIIQITQSVLLYVL